MGAEWILSRSRRNGEEDRGGGGGMELGYKNCSSTAVNSHLLSEFIVNSLPQFATKDS